VIVLRMLSLPVALPVLFIGWITTSTLNTDPSAKQSFGSVVSDYVHGRSSD
jgi:hypothetical protein